jgi:transposase
VVAFSLIIKEKSRAFSEFLTHIKTMARPALKLDLYIDKLCQALLVGATYDLAAKFAGVSYATFLTWRKQAETAPAGTALARLRDRMEEVEGQAAIGWLAKIEMAASQGNWQAAAWKLERRYPEQYGREPVKKVALTTPDGEEPWEGAVVWLPAKAVDADTWAANVEHLTHPNGASHSPREEPDASL